MNGPEDASHVKASWLEDRRREHEQHVRRRSLHVDLPKPEEPDDASFKREWLRRRRLEHDVAMTNRERITEESASAPLVEPSLLSTPTDRELYLRSIAKQRELAQRERLCMGDGPGFVPLVHASLLSTPSDRELYLRSIAEQRDLSQRERQRRSSEAVRRPLEALADSHDAREAWADDGCGVNFGCGPPPTLDDTSAADSTTTSAAEREEDHLAELEAMEALRLSETRSNSRPPSAGSGGGRGFDAASARGRLYKAGTLLPLPMSGPSILPPAPSPQRAGSRGASGTAQEAPAVMARSEEAAAAPSPLRVPSLSFRGEAWVTESGGPGAGEWQYSPRSSPHSVGSSPGRVLRLEDITIIKRR